MLLLITFIRHIYGEEFADTKMVFWNRQSKRTEKHNRQQKKDKRINNDIQNTAHKIKDRATRPQLKTGRLTQVHRKGK